MGPETFPYGGGEAGRLPILVALVRLIGEEPGDGRMVTGTILRTALGTLEAQAAHLLLLDPDTRRPESVLTCDHTGFREEEAPKTAWISDVRWDGSSEPVRILPTGAGPGWMLELTPFAEEAGWILHLPVGRDARTHGSLVVVRGRGPRFTAEDTLWAEGLAGLLALDRSFRRRGMELERIRSESRSIERTSRTLASSLDAGRVLDRTVAAAGELLGASEVAVWVPHGDDVRCAASLGAGAPEVDTIRPRHASGLHPVLSEGRSVLLPEDAHGGPHAIVPLHGGDQILGALQVRLDRGEVGLHGHRRLLGRLADQAAVAYENALLHNTVRTLSVTDPLTGLYNRRQLDLHLGQEFAAAKRGRPLSVVLLDVDGFKRFNDEEGHLAGDEVLAAVGRVLREETRAMNLAARYGGDEFMVVLSDTGAEGAAHHVERILRRLADDPELQGIGVGLSAGYATFDPTMTRPEDLISKADRALYRKKGRPFISTARQPSGDPTD